MTPPVKISTLWIVVMLNMMFADILSLYYPGIIDKLATGVIDGVTITPMLLLVSAVLIEVGIAMIFLTMALPSRISRVANLIAVVITLAFIIGGAASSPHYIFFASIEGIALIYIGYLAWHLPRKGVAA